MNLLAPVSTFESAVSAIKNGADEIYLGADDNFFNSFSFTGRGKYSFNDVKVLSAFDEVEKIVVYAHSKNVLVNFLCNTPFLTDNYSNDFEKAIISYINKAISIKVDSIVIADIGLLYLLKQKNITTPLHASLYFRTINIEQLKFFRELGVVRVTLPYLVTLDDIKLLTESKMMEIEVPGFLGCSFYNGACNCLHSLGEETQNNFDKGVLCKSKFVVENKCTQSVKGFIFDNEMGCSICSLKELDSIGVTALKIVGREKDYNSIGDVISIYKKALNSNFSKKDLPESWKMIWCRNNRCKFVNENRLKYYI